MTSKINKENQYLMNTLCLLNTTDEKEVNYHLKRDVD